MKIGSRLIHVVTLSLFLSLKHNYANNNNQILVDALPPVD
jgi:hypothetical protein